MKSISSVVSSLGPPLIGLIGVAVGLVLGNWLNQRSEQRKAERDERTRRRIRGEQVASELIKVCYETFDAARVAETAEGESEPLNERRDTLTHELRTRGHEIPDPGVRKALADVVTCFESFYAAVEMGEGRPIDIFLIARNTGVDVLRAYLHDEPMPDAGRVANIAAVIDAYWEDRIQAEQQWRKEERQRRARQRERANQSQEGKLDV